MFGSITACSVSDNINDSSINDENTVTTKINQEEYEIYKGTTFSEGIAFVELAGINSNVIAINTSGEPIFEVSECVSIDELSKFEKGIFVYENCIYDRYGEIIASPESLNYTEVVGFDDENVNSSNKSGFVIVSKLKKSYQGDKTLYGVINNKGKWEIELCEKGGWQYQQYEYSWEEGGLIEYNKYYFSDYSDEPEQYFNPYQPAIFEQINERKNMVLVNYSAEYFFEDAFIGCDYEWNDYENNYLPIDYMLWDYTGKAIIDLNKYKDNTISTVYNNPQYYNGHLLFTALNGTGSYYLFMLDKKGDFVFDPIELDTFDKYTNLDEEGFVLYKNSKWHAIDYSGKMTEYKNEFANINSFSEGLALAERHNGTSVYINNSGNIVIDKLLLNKIYNQGEEK